MKRLDDARELAVAMVAIGARAGIRTEAVITSMEAPLGSAVGNALEIAECIQLLRGQGPHDLTALVLLLATRMIVLAGLGDDERAGALARDALASGAALDRLRAMIAAQGGDSRIIDDPSGLPRAPHRTELRADSGGYLRRLDAGLIGRAAAALGAGRERVGDRVDHGAGILLRARAGDRIAAGDVLLELHYADPARLERAQALARASVQVAGTAAVAPPLVLDSVR
jgi:thymidine phosphorylase